ncbi:MAG: sporulation transcriptional regulator SpoIIID [Eubacteriales bacterium]|nr:sporulation transcriptional regulator SpoIIID [Eubacteriales bacterium]MCI6028021.1 sporulation transcriptional regulator SpoIIID [Clostridiales bacterium]MDD7414668.1 sporulation transcriptional regulator SpoIIID [Clostridiales bacterium]MDD7494147.1 sporulation transcriptional regulator SpoIIID [Clostridiales bacterium]MDY5709648.1 sporulation transcriptional regulator SpoIIID [Eubacteriales bacterium]
MYDYIEDRVIKVASYIVDSGATVRNAAALFGISKSTVHNDMTKRLRYLDPVLYSAVASVLSKNKAERHIRGGEATHRRYKGSDA